MKQAGFGLLGFESNNSLQVTSIANTFCTWCLNLREIALSRFFNDRYYLLLVFRQQGGDRGEIGPHHLCHLLPVLVKFECGHGLDPLISTDILRIVHIHFRKHNTRVFL